MKFKKISLISLVIVFIMSVFGIFSNTDALRYQFGINHSCQTLSNKDSFTIDLNLRGRRNDYSKLGNFILKIKFNNSLFDFKGIIPSESISEKDVSIEYFDDGIEIKFNPLKPRVVLLSNSFSEIYKVSFVCKSDSCCQSYFQTDIIDCKTRKQLLSEFTEVTIHNDIPTPNNATKISAPSNSNKSRPQNCPPCDCRLKSIIPSIGALSPSFDPNISKYKMEVPREVQEIYFDVVPISKNTQVKDSKHKPSTPMSITYINIIAKNKTQSLSYLIEIKRSVNSSETEYSDKVSKHNKAKSESACSDTDSENSKHTSKKHRSKAYKNHKHSKSKNSKEETDEEKFDEDEENSDDNKIENEGQIIQSSLKNNKIYWIVTFIILVLSAAVYLFFKRKSHLQEITDDTSKNDFNNFFEK